MIVFNLVKWFSVRHELFIPIVKLGSPWTEAWDVLDVSILYAAWHTGEFNLRSKMNKSKILQIQSIRQFSVVKSLNLRKNLF